MKALRIFIVLIYLIDYAYAVHKTSVEPERLIWGYMCAFIFTVLSIMGMVWFSQSSSKKEDK
jgi:hypothetical protein